MVIYYSDSETETDSQEHRDEMNEEFEEFEEIQKENQIEYEIKKGIRVNKESNLSINTYDFVESRFLEAQDCFVKLGFRSMGKIGQGTAGTVYKVCLVDNPKACFAVKQFNIELDEEEDEEREREASLYQFVDEYKKIEILTKLKVDLKQPKLINPKPDERDLITYNGSVGAPYIKFNFKKESIKTNNEKFDPDDCVNNGFWLCSRQNYPDYPLTGYIAMQLLESSIDLYLLNYILDIITKQERGVQKARLILRADRYLLMKKIEKMHDEGFIHMDLLPKNIGFLRNEDIITNNELTYINTSNHIFLIDFNLSIDYKRGTRSKYSLDNFIDRLDEFKTYYIKYYKIFTDTALEFILKKFTLNKDLGNDIGKRFYLILQSLMSKYTMAFKDIDDALAYNDNGIITNSFYARDVFNILKKMDYFVLDLFELLDINVN